MAFLLSLDQGTTSSRALVVDASGRVRAVAQKEFRQIFPRPGWVEHDPREIWSSQIAVARAALRRAGLRARDIAGIGIANQRETTMLWERRTGRPIHNAIVWQDRRTSAFCEAFAKGPHARVARQRTGLVLDAYFSASKVRWLLDHVPGARLRARRGELAFGTVDSWLLWKLTGGARHLTDATNASRTLFFNLHKGDWDTDLLNRFDVPVELLPTVTDSSEILGHTARGVFDAPIPIAGVAGDQQAALFGQACFTPGLGKCTYGTGCFLLIHAGNKPRISRQPLLTSVAWRLGGHDEFALEGSVFIGGAVVQWLRDGLGLIKSASDIEPLAAQVPDNGGVYFVPAFAGLGAPHWDQYARGTIAGLTRGTTSAHLARAALEGIAFQVADVLDVLRRDSSTRLKELRVDGGAAANNLLMQFQADILGVPVVRPTQLETTALGAAGLAGLAVGVWKDRAALARHWRAEKVFAPRLTATQIAARRSRWFEALRRSREWERAHS